MQNWNRRNMLRALGLSSLGLSISSHAYAGIRSLNFTDGDDKIMRLLYNENPYGPSEKAKELIVQNLGRSNRYCTFHQYDYQALKELIASQEGVKPDNILLGHGSFELLTWLAVHFGEGQGEIIVPSPTFDVVGLVARKNGGNVIPVEVTDTFGLNLDNMEARITPSTKLLTLCNPNNPTGKAIESDVLKKFCRTVSKKCPVLVDEAYIQYMVNWHQHTMAPLVAEGADVLISRTFSKIYGMAGLRIGFLMGPTSTIAELEKKFTLGFPGNMPNSLSVAAAIGALSDPEFINTSRKQNAEERGQLISQLDEFNFKYIDSHTNFVYFDVADFPAFKAFMRKNNIVLAGGWPTKPNWARVTIGKKEEMAFFASKIKDRAWL